jgi:hypothetical protein
MFATIAQVQKHSTIYGLRCTEHKWICCSSNSCRCYAFREIEEKWAEFKDEPHNIRLSLVVDGVNPFREVRFVYSVWPIFIINNIIPPWMSIKTEHIMLTMIVPRICLHYFF